MSRCPYGDDGYRCNIVSHPDAPNDAFCATCQRRIRFHNEDAASFWTIVQLLLVVAIVLTIVSKPFYKPLPSLPSSSLLSPPSRFSSP
jgi:hypothetical protein